MTNTQGKLQEDQYEFPYHHLVDDIGGFSQSKDLFWGYEYFSYLTYVANKLSTLPSNTVADVGCGDGRFVLELQRRFPQKRVVGIDYSERAIRFARAFNPDNEFIVSDLLSDESLQAAHSFDVVTLIEVLEHIPPEDARRFIERTAELLKPGGLIIITVPSDNVKLNPKHYQHFNPQLIHQVLDGALTIETIEYVNKKSPLTTLIQRLLGNKLFLLRYQPLVNTLYRWYIQHLFQATEKDGKRLIIVAEKSF